jgi:hypothetical protein
MEVAQVLRSTWDDKGGMVSAPKMDEVVCAHNFLSEKGRSRFCKRLYVSQIFFRSQTANLFPHHLSNLQWATLARETPRDSLLKTSVTPSQVSNGLSISHVDSVITPITRRRQKDRMWLRIYRCQGRAKAELLAQGPRAMSRKSHDASRIFQASLLSNRSAGTWRDSHFCLSAAR